VCFSIVITHIGPITSHIKKKVEANIRNCNKMTKSERRKVRWEQGGENKNPALIETNNK